MIVRLWLRNHVCAALVRWSLATTFELLFISALGFQLPTHLAIFINLSSHDMKDARYWGALLSWTHVAQGRIPTNQAVLIYCSFAALFLIMLHQPNYASRYFPFLILIFFKKKPTSFFSLQIHEMNKIIWLFRTFRHFLFIKNVKIYIYYFIIINNWIFCFCVSFL